MEQASQRKKLLTASRCLVDRSTNEKSGGDRWQMWFDGTDFEGKPASLRVEVLRKTPDLYRWSLSEKVGDNWKELASLDYSRKPGA